MTVLVNGVESSFVDLADPERLEFEYMQQMAAVLDALAGPGRPLRVLHLGGAACSLARALDARRPGSRQVAVEVDAALATLVRGWFDLPRAPRLRIRVGDARDVVAGLRPASQDVVVRDVFAGSVVPGLVRTTEFTALVARALGPTGIYLANCADVPPLAGTRREVATLATSFPHVGVVTEPAILKGRRHGNVVLVGAREPLPAQDLGRRLRCLPAPATVLTGDDVARFAGTARPIQDGDAPPSAPLDPTGPIGW